MISQDRKIDVPANKEAGKDTSKDTRDQVPNSVFKKTAKELANEVRAKKAGFKRRAKLENKQIEDIIYDYLEYRQSMDKLTPEQKKSLIAQLSRA